MSYQLKVVADCGEVVRVLFCRNAAISLFLRAILTLAPPTFLPAHFLWMMEWSASTGRSMIKTNARGKIVQAISGRSAHATPSLKASRRGYGDGAKLLCVLPRVLRNRQICNVKTLPNNATPQLHICRNTRSAEKTICCAFDKQ